MSGAQEFNDIESKIMVICFPTIVLSKLLRCFGILSNEKKYYREEL